MNSENTYNVKPFVFTKKVNNKYRVIPLNITTNTLGAIRHFPSANKEWFDSVYAFNVNSIKNLSIADKNLIKLIKNYFNLYFSKKVFKSKRLAIRFRRLAVNKIFISRAELKHTSSKIVITLYVYNEEQRVLTHRIKRLEAGLFSNKPFSLEEKLRILKTQENNTFFIDWLYEFRSYIIKQMDLEKNNLFLVKKNGLIKEKEFIIKNLNKDLANLTNIIWLCENDFVSYKYYESFYKNYLYKIYLEKEINIIAYYKLLLDLNKSKFENKFLSKLRPLIFKLYNKEVEFNIVNLKNLYLNSDIFTKAISLKLKNRDNKLLRVLKSSLSMIKLPKINKIKENYNKLKIKELLINKVSRYYINNKDNLNKILLDLFHDSTIFNNKYENNNNNKLLNLIFNILKYKNIAGIRLEAKGRLTRRFTASRSVFKIKWKGSLKNIDSSHRGLSSVILRGHLKSNIQYSLINSKTRNGAFGLKGWISSK